MIDEKSEKILAPLYSPFAEKLRQLIGALGPNWLVTEGLRSFAEQDAFYEQGRSRPGALTTRDRAGYSGHNYGTAAHVVPVTEDQVVRGDNDLYFKLATAARNLGLQWGGNDSTGKFVEMSRVEMVILTMDECLAIFKKGQLPAVWAAFDAKLGISKAPEPIVEPIAEPEAEVIADESEVEESDASPAIESEPETPELPPQKDSPVVARRKRIEAK